MNLTEKQFEAWLTAYGKAWEARNTNAFVSLFDDDAIYYWTPFESPKKGSTEIKEAFSHAVCRQRDIEFGARVLYTQARLGAAHWTCSLTRVKSRKRVHIDGICVVQFADNGRALSFREWWHTDER